MSSNSISSPPVDIPLFRTEEGRYLASSLGDPLIKGLTEVANKRPKDPIAYLATYLANFASNRENMAGSARISGTGASVHNNNTNTNQNGNENGTHEVTVVGTGSGHDTKDRPPQNIDVVAVVPDDDMSDNIDIPQSAFSAPNRDEHGQSMLHFAAARSHGRNALFQLLEETEINIGYRDELYRTARDVSIQAHIPENTAEIDRWVLHVAARGDTDKLVELLLEGYDHILDIVDEDGNKTIIEVVEERNQPATVAFLQSILAFEEKRERVHHAIRMGDLILVRELLSDEDGGDSGKLLAIGKNNYGRCSLHIAVLCQREEIADFIANTFADTLKIGDNLERTALHYAMGVERVETISKVLIKAGAKRVLKDLKGRQPSYYFMNKSEILRLQEEEETF